MTFWLDRFKKDDEEDIWEELKQMLLNPPSEQEIALKKQQEQADIDALLEKMFADETQETIAPALGKTPVSNQKSISNGFENVQNNFGASSTDMLNSIDGFGNILSQGIQAFSKKNEFPSLGKKPDLGQESLVPIHGDEARMYFRDPNQTDSNIERLYSTKNKGVKPQKEQYLDYEDLLPEETDEEREAREARELEAFDKAWDKANGVEDVEADNDGVLTGAASDINEKIVDSIQGIKNLPQDLLQKTKNKIFDNANKNFDKNNPMTLEEKAVQQGIEKFARGLFPMASDATRNGMHDMEAARKSENVTVYENLDSLEDIKIKDTLRKLGAKNTDKGAIYGIGSRESQQFQKSPELNEYLTNIREDVISGKPLEDTSFYYNAEGSDIINNKEKFDRYATARKITVLNPKVDENGIFTCDLVDYSNFANEPVTGIGTYLNKWGYKMQEKDKYKPHYQIIKIRKKVNW